MTTGRTSELRQEGVAHGSLDNFHGRGTQNLVETAWQKSQTIKPPNRQLIKASALSPKSTSHMAQLGQKVCILISQAVDTDTGIGHRIFLGYSIIRLRQKQKGQQSSPERLKIPNKRDCFTDSFWISLGYSDSLYFRPKK